MKKYLGLLLMALGVLIPLNVKAAIGLNSTCSNVDSNGLINCTISYNITDVESLSEISVTLTEKGGAKINSVESATGSDWTVTEKPYAGGVWTVKLESIGVTGAGALFSFSYTPSGHEDCGIDVEVEGTKVTVAPEKADTPTDNKQTGATLPYIALGGMVIIATGAYLATRNKAKMYKI